ncbi:hypothetical protein SAMN04487982_110173 [Streptomyces sp. ok210]|jgi:hypothetical protein|nr:hypothetical protein SAMN04487982_110173 [Streptomyces sp. ok210]
MKKSSNGGSRPTSRRHRVTRRLTRHGRQLHRHALQGLGYGLGSGAVSLLLLWIQNRL